MAHVNGNTCQRGESVRVRSNDRNAQLHESIILYYGLLKSDLQRDMTVYSAPVFQFNFEWWPCHAHRINFRRVMFYLTMEWDLVMIVENGVVNNWMRQHPTIQKLTWFIWDPSHFLSNLFDLIVVTSFGIYRHFFIASQRRGGSVMLSFKFTA